MKKVLDYDPLHNTIQYFHSDGAGKFAIETVQNLSPLLGENKEIRSHQRSGWRGDLHHVARIPISIADEWTRELGDSPFHPRNRKWLAAKLNSSDWMGLRTKDGKI